MSTIGLALPVARHSETNRIFVAGSMIGQDDILFNKDREHTYKAYSELFALKLEREIFEKMMKNLYCRKIQQYKNDACSTLLLCVT